MGPPTSPRFVLLSYLAGLISVIGIAVIVDGLNGTAWPDTRDGIGAGVVVLGGAWIVLGYLTGASASSSLAPGASQDRPRLGATAWSMPSRNPQVVADLRAQLDDSADPSLVLIGLGALLTATGFLLLVSMLAGVVGLVALFAAVTVLLARGIRPVSHRS